MGSFAELPEHVVFDILSRLPAKSVGMCRCVWKPWKALLSQPKFIRAHLQMNTLSRQQSLTFISTSELDKSMSAASLTHAHHMVDKITLSPTKLAFGNLPNDWSQIYASCGGMVFAYHMQDKEFVLNPITREVREVPRWPGFDPAMCQSFGMGYDSVNDDYKVVAVYYYPHRMYKDSQRTFVCVFSLKNDCWKRIEYSHTVDCCHWFGLHSGVYVDGHIHWLVDTVVTLQGKDKRTTTIEALDLAGEKFCRVEPPCLIDEMRGFQLAILDGCLCLFNHVSNHTDQTRVWVMKEYGVPESWTKITIDGLGSQLARGVLCSIGQGEIGLWKTWRDDYKLAIYNVKEATLKDVDGILFSLFGTVSFVESLVSPHA